MENDQVFTGSANIDATLTLRSRPSQRGHDAMSVAPGGFDVHKDTDHESTPLLAGDEENRDGRPETPSEDMRRGGAEWEGESDFNDRPWWRKPSVFWILPAFFLTTIAFGGSIVPKLNVILSLVCRQYLSDRSAKDPRFQSMPVILGNDNPQCQIPAVQSLVAQFTLYGNLIASLLSALISPKLGSLSDRYGRKKLMAYGASGLLVSDLITVLVARHPEMFHVNWLLVGFFFDGICGSFTGGMALAHAYASDCTPPARRNVVFGWFHASLFGGVALGPIIGGYITKASGDIVIVFYITMACHGLYFLFLFIVPDSLSQARQQAAREKKRFAEEEAVGPESSRKWLVFLNGYNIFEPLAILFPTGEGLNSAIRRNLVLLASVDTLMFGVAMGSITILLIYSEFMFDWGTFETARYLTIINVTRVSVLLVGLPLISRIFRGPRSTAIQQHSGSDLLDVYTIRASVCFDLIGYIGYATVKTGTLYTLCGVMTSFGGMASPTITASLTKHVPQDRTGQILGAMGLLHALARLVAPTIFNLIYSVTVATAPQTVFICLAATFGVAFLLSWFIRPHVHWDEEKRQMSQPGDGSRDADS
ncbi:hypothetical protein MMC07_004142 [Pseudocyphellaria aurata]|nr:hypothetical protein [Pseudocyphellaria aurata]